ncbi:MAG: hypothetical protein Q4C64_03440 [Erysipelotrichia bacterium]|nr:hypothetical protein [Erysipelotrichia bacterium]
MQVDDYVKINNTSFYDRVIKLENDYAWLEYAGKFALSKLTVIPPKKVTKNDLRNYFRMNKFYFKEVKDELLKENFICSDTFLPSKEDLIALLINLKIKNVLVVDYFSWVRDINFTFKDNYLPYQDISDNELDKVLLMTDGDLFAYVFSRIHDGVDDAEDMEFVSDLVDLNELISLISLHIKNENSSVREYADCEKEIYLSYIDDQDILAEITPQQQELYKQFALDLVQKENKIGLETCAYAYYGGNAVFECDWLKARDLLEKLYHKYGLAAYANSLGYIYYYGRANNGIAQDDLAFRYFSIGAAAGIYESVYHQADMFYYGRGVTENKVQAISTYFNLYEENKKIFSDEFFDCKFADIALRLGTVFMSKNDPNYEIAYFYLLQAEFAIKKRREIANFYGDDRVEEKIIQAITNCRKKLGLKSQMKLVQPTPIYIRDLFDNNNRIRLRLRQLKNNRLKMEFETIADSDGKADKHLFTFVPFNKCLLSDKIVIYAENVNICSDKTEYVITNYICDENTVRFFFFETLVLEIEAADYVIYNR